MAGTMVNPWKAKFYQFSIRGFSFARVSLVTKGSRNLPCSISNSIRSNFNNQFFSGILNRQQSWTIEFYFIDRGGNFNLKLQLCLLRKISGNVLHTVLNNFHYSCYTKYVVQRFSRVSKSFWKKRARDNIMERQKFLAPPRGKKFPAAVKYR